MRGHGKALAWDHRFEPYFRRAGLLPFALQFKREAPNYNHAALSALVDRWRPETHSFHLSCGEMTVTLQDISMIGGLPVNGRPLIGRVEKRNWRDRVIGLIGDCPPASEAKDNRSSGVPFNWLMNNMSGVPVGANEGTIERRARAYMWYMFRVMVKV